MKEYPNVINQYISSCPLILVNNSYPKKSRDKINPITVML